MNIVDFFDQQTERKRPPTPRDDLQALIDFAHLPNLASLLQTFNIKKVLEVGGGNDLEALNQINQVDKAIQLVSTDPQYGQVGMTGPIRLLPLPIETLSTASDDADLILCKGVVSSGSGIITGGREKGFPILTAIIESLNSNNPHAVAVISTKFPDAIIPYTLKELETLGFKILHSVRPIKGYSDTNKWLEALQSSGIFPGATIKDFFTLAICRKK
jgi:hypothetical protein